MPKLQNPRVASTVGYLTLAAIDSYLAGRDGKAARRSRFLTKPLLMPTLAATTHLAGRENGNGLVRPVLAAQAFSWGGDLALMGHSKKSFLAGVGSFFAAHVAYIGGFAAGRDPGASLSAPGVRTAAGAWLLVAPAVAVQAGRQDPALRVPIAAYAAALSAMFASSTLLHRSIPAAARRRIVAGTSLFLLSDSLLSIERFIRRERSPALATAVMATYTAGQWLIAEGAVTTDDH